MKAEKNCGVRVGGRGGCRLSLTPRTRYSQHQSNKCEELLVDSWQQISAQLMRWVICKEQSLSDSSQGTHFPSHRLNSRQREQSSNLTWLQVSFSKNTERKKSSWKNAGFQKALFLPSSTSWPWIFSITQNWTALAGWGHSLPVFCCPNTATLITVSPSDRTLVFLLLARWLAERPGQLDEGTTVQMFTLLPITEGWEAQALLYVFPRDFQNAVKSCTWKVKVDEN